MSEMTKCQSCGMAIESGMYCSYCVDAQGNLLMDTIDWDESTGGRVSIESPGLVMIGGLTDFVIEQNIVFFWRQILRQMFALGVADWHNIVTRF